MMKYNEKVERCAPKLGRKNLFNGLSCPPFVYMDVSDDGMWVHYVKYCENFAKQKYKRCWDNAWWCRKLSNVYTLSAYTHRGWKIAVYYDKKAELYRKWNTRWLKIAELFKDKEAK